MSESEEDVAFESADEGDEENHAEKTSKHKPSKAKEVKSSYTPDMDKTNTPSVNTETKQDSLGGTEKSEMVDTGAKGEEMDEGAGAVCEEKGPEAMEISERGLSEKMEDTGSGDGADTRAAGDVRNALDKLTGSQSEPTENQSTGSGWGSWTSWGSSILSTATDSVSTFTHQVEEGLSTVMETVEAGLSVPTPEDMAYEKIADDMKEHDAGSEEEEITETTVKDVEEKVEPKEESQGGGWLSGWGVSGLTNVVQSTVAGSLDVLETLGKKTMDVLNEGDPGLKKTKSLFTGRKENQPVLSEMLREAKKDYEHQAEAEKELEESRQAHFGFLFDEYQGLAHLEALEMLSNQSEIKVQAFLTTIQSQKLQELKPNLILIKEAFEIGDLDDEDEDFDEKDFIKLFAEYLSNLRVQASPDKLIKSHSQIVGTIKKHKEAQDAGEGLDAKVLHRDAIQALAEIASKFVEQYHKAGELMLMKKEDTIALYEERAKNVANLTRTFCSEVGYVSTKFTECLNTTADDSEDPDSITPLITNVYLEATNSSTYIQEAFQLLLPVIQLAAIESTMS